MTRTLGGRGDLPVESLALVRTIGDVQLSPDGRRVAYVVTAADLKGDRHRTTIFVTTDGGAAMPLTDGSAHDTRPRWSPDGQWIAFVSDRHGGPRRVFVMRADGAEPRQLTSVDGAVGPPAWSPDAARLAFTARVARGRGVPGRPEQPRMVTRARYKADGEPDFPGRRETLFIVDVDGGQPVALAPDAEGDDRAPAWSPDARRLAFSRVRAGRLDCRPSDIWVWEVPHGEPRRITDGVEGATSPSWSPDGGTIAFYGTVGSDLGLGELLVRVWTIAAAGGAPRMMVPGFDRGVVLVPDPDVTPAAIWSADGVSLTFNVADAGNIHVVRAGLDGTVCPVVVGERQITKLTAAPAVRRLAFCAADAVSPGNVHVCHRSSHGRNRSSTWGGSLQSRGYAAPRTGICGSGWPNAGRSSRCRSRSGSIGWPRRRRGKLPRTRRVCGAPR